MKISPRFFLICCFNVNIDVMWTGLQWIRYIDEKENIKKRKEKRKLSSCCDGFELSIIFQIKVVDINCINSYICYVALSKWKSKNERITATSLIISLIIHNIACAKHSLSLIVHCYPYQPWFQCIDHSSLKSFQISPNTYSMTHPVY